MSKICTLGEFSSAIEESVPLYETKKMTNRGYEYIPQNTTTTIKLKKIQKVQPYQKPPLGKLIARGVVAPLLAGGAAYLVVKSLENPTRRLIKKIKHGKGRVKAHTRKGKLVKSHRRK